MRRVEIKNSTLELLHKVSNFSILKKQKSEIADDTL